MENPPEITDNLIRMYLREELDRDLRDYVETTAMADESIAAEIELQRSIRHVFNTSVEPTVSSWDEFSERISAETSLREMPVNASEVMKVANDNSGRRLWQGIAAALALVVTGQFFMINNSGSQNASEQYQTASAESSGAQLKVAFKNTVEHSELNQLLIQAEAQIVAGPSALGFYDLAFNTDDACKAGRELFADSDVFETVAECAS